MESFFGEVEVEPLTEMQKSFPETFNVVDRLLCHYLFTGVVESYADCNLFSVFSIVSPSDFNKCVEFVRHKRTSSNDLEGFVVESWNSLHKRCLRLNPQRKSKLAARLKEQPSRNYWEDVFQSLRNRPWLLKESWFTFDFLVRPGSTDKILDGWMDWRVQGQKVFKDSSYEDALKEKLDVH